MAEHQAGAVYSLAAVSRMVGLSAVTLESWHEHYGLATPVLTPGGHALYSRDQVEELRFVKARVDQGMQLSDAIRDYVRLREAGSPGLPSPAAAGGGRPVMILLAGHDPYAAQLSDYFLRTEGYNVVLSFDVASAKKSCEDVTPDLSIVDLTISGGVGVDLCRWIKERSDAPLLAVASFDAGEYAVSAGADAFLSKPIDPLQLVSAVKDLLGASAFLRGGENPQ